VNLAVRHSSRRQAVVTNALRVALIVLLIGIWAGIAMQTRLVPSVAGTFRTLADGFWTGWLVGPLVVSLSAALAGFLGAALTGIVVGVWLGRGATPRQVFAPVLNAFFGVPRVILYPVLLAIFGATFGAKGWLAFFGAFFPIAMTTMAAMRAVDGRLVSLGRSLLCSRYQALTKIYFPATAPTIVGSLRIGFSVAFVNTIVAEFFSSDAGLGVLVQQAYALQQQERMFAAVVLIVLVAFVGNMLLWSLERRLQHQ
jgi:NitT/TauT family transport system permease protein